MNENDFQNWFETQRHHLTRGGLWLRGDEPNRLPRSQWDERPFRVLFSRLSTWHDTLESFTHRLMYAMLADIPGVYPDLAFVPPVRDGQVMRDAGVPWLLGSGSHRGALDFDVVAFSNALVQETVNVEPMLARSGIPIDFAERMRRSDVPLVILGGANSLYSSMLYGDNPMVDGVFIGEEPAVIQRLFLEIKRLRAEGFPKDVLLDSLTESVPGFFRADRLRPVAVKRHESKPQLNSFKPREPVAAADGVAGIASLQISEGCPYFCSFCAESWSRKPYREVPPDQARLEARELKKELGLTKVDLYSFNFNTYEHIRPLVAELLEDFSGVGLKSQRFDALAHDPSFVRLLTIAGKNSITCGLEGVSNRLRSYLQKDVSDVELDRSLDNLLRARLRELKIFVIITGLETEDDIAEFGQFLARVRLRLDRSPARPRVMVSSTPLVRFPWTPLEFEDMPDAKLLQRLSGLVKSQTVRSGFEFRGAAGVEEAWVSQVLVRMRHDGVREAVRAAREKTDFVFRDIVTTEFYEAVREELLARDIPLEVAVQGATPEEEVPWMDLDPGVKRRFLVREWKRCREFLQTPVCLGWVGEEGNCHACGACTPEERDAITHERQEVKQDLDELERRIKALRASEKVIEMRVELLETARGLPMDLIQAMHARAWMRCDDDLVVAYRRHEKSGRAHESDDCLATGLDVLRPVFLGHSEQKVRQYLSDPAFLERVNAHFAPWGKVLGPAASDDAEGGQFVLRLPFVPKDSAWVSHLGLKHTFRKEGVVRVFDFPKETLKKKVLKSLRVQPQEDNPELWEVHIHADSKFVLRETISVLSQGQEVPLISSVQAHRLG